jgi:hypothetical protein
MKYSSTDAVTEILVLFLISKFFISASFLIIYPFAGELYPTQLRGIGIGMSAYIAGLGLTMIPFVTYLVSLCLILYINLAINVTRKIMLGCEVCDEVS